MKRAETIEEGDLSSEPIERGVPGLILVSSSAGPCLRGVPVRSSGLEIGRGTFAGQPLEDDRMSRRHGRVSCDGSTWTVVDLGSRNGTFVDGEKIEDKWSGPMPRVIRMGRSVFIPVTDAKRFDRADVERRGDALVGPTLKEAWEKIARAAQFGDTLHISGESGVGKELAARAFHDLGARPQGPFIAVNCAAIPEGLAERLLFGARKGAYSGATADAEGYVQAADKGTLFLDEVADLDPAVQAKLLRVLESREVMALGASKARAVDLRVCSATRDLRGAVASGSFREDLYFRIGRPEVVLPSLRDRREEIPFLIAAELEKLQRDLTASPALVELCIARPWPGNIRELLGEIRRTGHEALADNRTTVEAKDLGPSAGMGFSETQGDRAKAGGLPDREVIEQALKDENGNVTRAAKALGLHRNQLRRWLAKHGNPALSQGGDDE
jgi:transcriptional regulator with PAS, ATPase and Fis domain